MLGGHLVEDLAGRGDLPGAAHVEPEHPARRERPGDLGQGGGLVGLDHPVQHRDGQHDVGPARGHDAVELLGPGDLEAEPVTAAGPAGVPSPRCAARACSTCEADESTPEHLPRRHQVGHADGEVADAAAEVEHPHAGPPGHRGEHVGVVGAVVPGRPGVGLAGERGVGHAGLGRPGPSRRAPAQGTGSVVGRHGSRAASNASMASALCSVMPTSSRPSSRR